MPPRRRRDRGDDRLGQALGAPARAARRAGAGPAATCWPSCRRSISCWSRASSATPFPKLEVHRAANGKPLLHPDDPHIVAIASDAPLPQAERAGGRARRHRGDRRRAARARRRRCERGAAAHAERADGAAHRRLLRLRRPAAAGRRHGAADRRARRAGGRDRERAARRGARPRARRSDVVAPLDLPPFDNSAVDGYAVRHADLDAAGETRLAVAGRVTAGSAATAPLGAGEAIRIFTGAPMPAGADTVFMQEDVPRRGRRRHRAAGPQARRQPPARRRGRARGRGRAAGRPAARARRTSRSPPRSA